MADLTTAPDIGDKAWTAQFDLMRSIRGTYYIVVVVDRDSDRILGTGALVLEYKFIRGGSSIGHIEDIAVSKQAQGKKIGLHLVKALTQLSESLGNYKCILDCNEEHQGKCGDLPFVDVLMMAVCMSRLLRKMRARQESYSDGQICRLQGASHDGFSACVLSERRGRIGESDCRSTSVVVTSAVEASHNDTCSQRS